ncbi:hypothetical protein BpHYR1_008275 [Brachionus plicatilis]|uniref:Uncharacterized protein n=1 Tax=Brachionus plicatilis TaxID=10195 RepID=A0A3M7STC2_BRAPC|nr:hypothetical protein BpHYR1_008275 [Brachionus plicatilis]
MRTKSKLLEKSLAKIYFLCYKCTIWKNAWITNQIINKCTESFSNNRRKCFNENEKCTSHCHLESESVEQLCRKINKLKNRNFDLINLNYSLN